MNLMCNYKKLANKNFEFILKKYNYNLHPGDIVAGTIIYRETYGLVIHIGDTIIGYLPREEISLKNNQEIQDKDLLYTTREFFILAYNMSKKHLILSIRRLEYIRAWKRLKQIYKENIIFNVKKDGLNKGGVIVYLENLQSFIPNSHISHNHHKQLLDNEIQCKLLILDEKDNQIILSNKSAILQLSIHQFRIHEIVYGKIISIKKYGLFIEINNILALLHISEIGLEYIENLYESFIVEQIIKIKIIHIDCKQGRLTLSKKYCN